MLGKNEIKLLYSLIFLLCSISIIYLSFPYLRQLQRKKIYNIIENINTKNKKLAENSLNSLAEDFFYAIWKNENNQGWMIIVYDKDIIDNSIKNPEIVQENIAQKVEKYSYVINESRFLVWINKFNIYFYSWFIILILILSLIYLLILFLLHYLLNNKQKKQRLKKNENRGNLIYDLTDEEIRALLSYRNDKDNK